MNARTGYELIDAIHGSVEMASRIRYRLRSIAGALDRVGMTTLADEIESIADVIVEGPKAVQDAHSGYQTEQVRHNEAMMGNLLKATLAGCIGPANRKEQP